MTCVTHKHYNHSISLSLTLTLTLSRHSLPLSRPLPPSLSPSSALPLPRALNPKSSTPTWAQGQEGFKMARSTFFSTCSSPGSLGFQVLRAGKSSFKVLQLVPARSIFLGGSKWFSLVNHLLMHPWTRIQEGFNFGGLVFPPWEFMFLVEKNAVGPGDSGYKPGYSGFGTLRGKLRV